MTVAHQYAITNYKHMTALSRQGLRLLDDLIRAPFVVDPASGTAKAIIASAHHSGERVRITQGFWT